MPVIWNLVLTILVLCAQMTFGEFDLILFFWNCHHKVVIIQIHLYSN
jgi:hypothetical protein